MRYVWIIDTEGTICEVCGNAKAAEKFIEKEFRPEPRSKTEIGMGLKYLYKTKDGELHYVSALKYEVKH